MIRWLKTCSVLAALSLLMALPSVAQLSAVRGGLGGVVYDASGSVIPGATVKITGPQGNYVVAADATGRYALTGVVPGSYNVVIEVPGFKKFVSNNNQVTVDHTANLDVHLVLGAVTDTVQVDAGAVQIDTQNTSLNAPLSDQLYQSLPVARNVAAIFSLAPGVVSGGGTGTSNPSIGGATGLENLYMVDGVTITDQAFGGLGTYNRYFGSLGSGVNLAFIKEVDVKTGAFEPKYGRADGGIVEIVTKSGSNTYHGALAAYLGPGSWYAEPLSIELLQLHQHDSTERTFESAIRCGRRIRWLYPSFQGQAVLLRRLRSHAHADHRRSARGRAAGTHMVRMPIALRR